MPAHYLKVFFINLTTLIALVGAFNYIVDPFDLFSSKKINNFNAEKTEFNKFLRLAKAHQVRYYQPGAIILGTSRAEYGLDPQHPAWSEEAQPVYNLGLSNGRIEESLAYLKHAHAQNKLKQVVLGADFFMFGEQFRVNIDYFTNRLNLDGTDGLQMGWFMDIINSLFTLDAFFESINTIKSQGTGLSLLYQSDGMRSSANTWQQIKAKGGHSAVFLADIHHDLLFPAGLATYSLNELYNKPTYSPTLDIFTEFVRFCLEQGIELKIIISPMHAYKLETLSQMGLWELFEYWKIRLTTIVENENQRMPAAEPVEIWDFSGYNSRTTEPVPGKKEPDSRMQWYWEGSHYRREYGDDILDCVLGDKQADKCFWGQLLSPDNIRDHLALIRAAGANYRAIHSADIKLLQELIRDTKEQRDALRQRVGWRPM